METVREFPRLPTWRLERSGEVNEKFIFGEPRTGPEYRQDLEKLIQEHRDKKIPLALGEAVGLIKRYQPYQSEEKYIPQDPTNPKKKFPRDLRKEIAARLGLAKPEDDKRVLFWSAVGTIVDKDFGADAVIEVKGKSENEPSKFVRLDVTLYGGEQPKSEEEMKDLVVIGRVPDAEDEADKYAAFLDSIADKAAGKLGMAREAPTQSKK